MTINTTETRNELAIGLDALPSGDILKILHDGQVAAATCVAAAIPQIRTAAKKAAETLRAGGRLGYAAAGSSGLMAMADGLELPGTYGLARDRLVILLAGGAGTLSSLTGGPDDDPGLGEADIEHSGLGKGDCLVIVSASGTTPYAIEALHAARSRDIFTIGMANNDATPVLDGADIFIHLNTPPEIIAGSTRMGAGTAQKIALNMLSTLMAVHLGHVHDGHMVNVQADNAKLKSRACRMVADISGCEAVQATGFLEQSNGSVKVAILLAAGAKNTDTARQWLASSGQQLRPSLARLKQV